jgi:hypothetical protein
MNWWAAKTQLIAISQQSPPPNNRIARVDVSDNRDPVQKALLLLSASIDLFSQEAQLGNPSCMVNLDSQGSAAATRLSDYVLSAKGVCTGDSPRFVAKFWERSRIDQGWSKFRSSVTQTEFYAGCHDILYWQDGKGVFVAFVKERLGGSTGAWIRGAEAWGKLGIAIARMRNLPVSLYLGEIFDDNSGVLIPNNPSDLGAVWAYCSSDDFRQAVRELNQKVSVDNTYLKAIPFDLEKWRSVADEVLPHGIPRPHSGDPTQWLFKGEIVNSANPLQVAVARLLDYRWPDQPREHDSIGGIANKEGIVCIPPVRSEPPAAERLLEVLQVAYGTEWSNAVLNDLLAKAGCKAGTSLDDWLRNSFFEQHCKLFHQRPFIWHIWDGRKDGFSCLVNYHKLNHKTLENLTYSYLADWIKGQNADAKAGRVGADLRLAAAQALQEKLKLILAGEPPYDIFVRWKPLSEQAIGWNPDVNDGVRMNIRPFAQADILRKPPNIKWTKDRGKEPERDRDEYPWFWKGKEVVGDRVNDVHLSNAEKLAARKGAK